MDWADHRHLIVKDTRRTLLGNTLVLVMPRDRLRQITISRDLDLASLLGPDGRIATGDPASVPVGTYARQALTALGLWSIAEPRLARSDSVRSALLLVERGEAPLGIVYRTDAAVAPNVAIAGIFPDTTHDRITYPFAVPTAGDTPEARALLTFLQGAEAQAAFTRRGFLNIRQ
jgi:molybdate transport system substrate-binding protein